MLGIRGANEGNRPAGNLAAKGIRGREFITAAILNQEFGFGFALAEELLGELKANPLVLANDAVVPRQGNHRPNRKLFVALGLGCLASRCCGHRKGDQ